MQATGEFIRRLLRTLTPTNSRSAHVAICLHSSLSHHLLPSFPLFTLPLGRTLSFRWSHSYLIYISLSVHAVPAPPCALLPQCSLQPGISPHED